MYDLGVYRVSGLSQARFWVIGVSLAASRCQALTARSSTIFAEQPSYHPSNTVRSATFAPMRPFRSSLVATEVSETSGTLHRRSNSIATHEDNASLPGPVGLLFPTGDENLRARLQVSFV